MFGIPSQPHADAAALLFPELAGAEPARLTQGLLRAPRRGRRAAPVLSLLRCEAGVAGAPGAAMTPGEILAQRGWEDAALLDRAAAARRALVATKVGGAWWREAPASMPAAEGYALVALTEPAAAGCAPVFADAALLDRASAEHAPERIAIIASGWIGRRLRARLAALAARGTTIIDRPCDPWCALEGAGRVYSAGGEIGFLALLAGVPVSVVADAFYTGWGVTSDEAGVKRRGFSRSVEEIFAGACLLATRYRDPFRDTPTGFEQTLETLADWRRIEEANRTIAACVGMAFWKRRRVADFVRTTAAVPPFRRDIAGTLAAAETSGGAVAGWASRLPDGLTAEAAHRGIRLIRVEDGFIRSVGLGSDFLPPASLVFDSRGMYYDPRSDSDLQHILRDTQFAAPLLARAERLTALLVQRRVTKYNLAGDALGEAAAGAPVGRRRILVPGQVEDDLSITFGAGTVRTNLALLAEVRRANPDAYVLYKPHPDVLAGHRKGAVAEAEARRFADVVVTAGSLPALLAGADELHTMTSLAGFEALLRGCRVVAYGRPFYAGWGLTEDRPAFDRGRSLTLAELVAGALILYPRYLDPLTRLPCGPEVIVERLDAPELWRPGTLVAARRLQGWAMRKLAAGRLPAPPAGVRSVRQLRERLRP